MWTEQTENVVTVNECLANQIDMLQTKNQHKKQYDFLNSKNQFIYKPLYLLDKIEQTYLPSWVNYRIKDNKGDIIMAHNACVSQPTNLMSDFKDALPQFPVPSVVGARWSYSDAIAKSLQELAGEIDKGLDSLGIAENPTLNVLVKDSGNGLGDVSQYKEKCDRYLEDKPFRYLFCILNGTVEQNKEILKVWEEDKPGSVHTNKTLIEAVCDENQTPAMVMRVIPIENECEHTSQNFLSIHVQIGTVWRDLKIKFTHSMEDEKHTCADGGLQGALSRYICDLCYATQDSAKTDRGTFKICCTLEETKQN